MVIVMARNAAQLAVDAAEYLARERESEARHELWRGEVFAMVGASWAHNLVTTNLVAALHAALRGTKGRAVSSDLKVHVPLKQGFVYPDVVVVCDPPRFFDERSDVVENPVLVAEVLSPGTERFDRGDKADGYRSIPSVRTIVLLSQEERLVEAYERMDDDSWRLRVHKGDTKVELDSPRCSIALADVYDGVPLVDR
jgi:Uma2 family endonuclease